MQSASTLFTDVDKQRIEQAVAAAEAQTSCEIMPVVATSSGRYDRAEDMIGLWLATITAIVLWLALPRHATEPGSWGQFPLAYELMLLVAGIVAAFAAGAWAGSRVGWLRRLFTPRVQMEEEVARRAKEVFFDTRVHHTAGATGLLVYLSLFEHMARVLVDQKILDHPALGQAFVDRLCRQLTEAMHRSDPTVALCETIHAAGQQLANPLPRAEDDVNELQDALVVLD